jgi:hypothetical protein
VPGTVAEDAGRGTDLQLIERADAVVQRVDVVCSLEEGVTDRGGNVSALVASSTRTAISAGIVSTLLC